MTYFRHRVTGPGSAGDVWVTTLHTQGAGAINAVHTAFVNAMSTFIDDHFTQYWSPEQSVSQFLTDQLDPVTGHNVLQLATDVNYVGVGAGQTVSPRSCLIISLKSALPTRRGRGRMYWPSPCSDGYGPNGEFLIPLITEISGAFKNALDTISAASTPVIYHRDTKTSEDVLQVRVGSIPGTQTRRTNKVTNNYISNNV